MADTMKKNYKISGSGFLTIDGDAIIITVEDKGEYNLARVLADLNDRPVKFNFSYDEEYEATEEEEIEVDVETGEVV